MNSSSSNKTTKREKGYHQDNVARVSCRGCQLWNVVVCYDPSIPHGLNTSLTVCL